jgi:poly-gamma-glutamate biosynthesis protein PgsC/CapC
MNLTESIAIGLVFGFFFYEWFGLSAGGFVVPGYIALQFNNPLLLGGTLAVSLLTFLSVKIASRYTILYGRRRFILMVLTGFAWQWGFRLLLIRRGAFTDDLDIFGFIIPGLIANEMERQGSLPTFTALLVISAMVRLSLIALGLL